MTAKMLGVLEPHREDQRPTTDAENVAWFFHPDRDLWVPHGFDTWDQARPWISAPAFARAPSRAAVWNQANVSVTEAEQWETLDVPTEAAIAFRKIGVVSPEEGALWCEYGFRDFASVVHLYLSMGLDPDRVDRWWSAADIPVPDRYTWVSLGIIDPAAAVVWRELGADIQRMHLNFKALRLDDKNPDDWAAVGITLPGPWIFHQFTPDVAADWRTTLHDCHPKKTKLVDDEWATADIARGWHAGGYPPEAAATRIRDGEEPLDPWM